MRTFLTNCLLLCLLALQALGLSAQDLPVIRLGALAYGTVNWELDTIRQHNLDSKNGFQLEVVPMGGGNASDIAFLGGEIDVMVSDLIWAAAQRANGRDVRFVPYSTSVGGIMVQPASGISSITDLSGKTIGIAGGPLDKNWIVLQAYAKSNYGIDLRAITEQEFGAPPIMYKAALDGKIDAVINFWHFQAKAKAAGMQEIISVQQASADLGLNTNTPLLGYIVRGTMPEPLVQGLYAASRQAKEILQNDAGIWDSLRGRIKPKNEAELEALRQGFRAGIPTSSRVDLDDANRFMALIGDFGGQELLGKATAIDDELVVNRPL